MFLGGLGVWHPQLSLLTCLTAGWACPLPGRWFLTHLKRIPITTLSLRIVQNTCLETKTRTSSSIHSSMGDFFMWPDSSLLAGLGLSKRQISVYSRDPTGITAVAIPMCRVSLFVWVTHLPLVQSGSTELCTQELLKAYTGVLGTGLKLCWLLSSLVWNKYQMGC